MGSPASEGPCSGTGPRWSRSTRRRTAASWDDSTGWLSDAPLGDWYGVTTDTDGRVLELSPRRQQSDRDRSRQSWAI